MVPVDMFPQTINPRLFRLHNPARRKPPRKAVDVFPRTIAPIKIQGFPASRPPKSTFSAGGKSPESPVFKPFFSPSSVFYICHQHYALNMHSMREHVYGLDCCSFIAMFRKEAHITGKGSRVA
jgi:hypothetical protein